MLLFPLIHLAQFRLLMAIEENCDQIIKKKADPGGEHNLIFHFAIYKNKQTKRNNAKHR